MDIRQVFETLRRHYGPQGWWPGDSPMEVALGAILTQRTTWTNAAAAVRSMSDAGLLDLDILAVTAPTEIEPLVRPAGFFRQKAARVVGFARWLRDAGGFDSLAARTTGDLRRDLMSLRGIGPETADCILLYACRRPVFVVDEYARRLFERLGLFPDGKRPGYETLRHRVEAALDNSESDLNEFHALIVEHGKLACRATPVCEECVLLARCPRGGARTATVRRS